MTGPDLLVTWTILCVCHLGMVFSSSTNISHPLPSLPTTSILIRPAILDQPDWSSKVRAQEFFAASDLCLNLSSIFDIDLRCPNIPMCCKILKSVSKLSPTCQLSPIYRQARPFPDSNSLNVIIQVKWKCRLCTAQWSSTFHVASVHRASKDLDLCIKNSSDE